MKIIIIGLLILMVLVSGCEVVFNELYGEEKPEPIYIPMDNIEVVEVSVPPEGEYNCKNKIYIKDGVILIHREKLFRYKDVDMTVVYLYDVTNGEMMCITEINKTETDCIVSYVKNSFESWDVVVLDYSKEERIIYAEDGMILDCERGCRDESIRGEIIEGYHNSSGYGDLNYNYTIREVCW